MSTESRRKENLMGDKFQISMAAARVNAGLTQEDVARELKVGKQTVINWEQCYT